MDSLIDVEARLSQIRARSCDARSSETETVAALTSLMADLTRTRRHLAGLKAEARDLLLDVLLGTPAVEPVESRGLTHAFLSAKWPSDLVGLRDRLVATPWKMHAGYLREFAEKNPSEARLSRVLAARSEVASVEGADLEDWLARTIREARNGVMDHLTHSAMRLLAAEALMRAGRTNAARATLYDGALESMASTHYLMGAILWSDSKREAALEEWRHPSLLGTQYELVTQRLFALIERGVDPQLPWLQPAPGPALDYGSSSGRSSLPQESRA